MNDSLRHFIHAASLLSESNSGELRAMPSLSSPPPSQYPISLTPQDFYTGIPADTLQTPIEPPQDQPVSVEELTDLMFKLRSYMDPEMGEYAAGMEAGMSRAADMIQNLLSKLQD